MATTTDLVTGKDERNDIAEIEEKIQKNVVLRRIIEQNSHLLTYLVNNYDPEFGVPVYLEKLDREHKKIQTPNIIYPAGGPIFIHVFPGRGRNRYAPIEPVLDVTTKGTLNFVMAKLTSLIKPGDIPSTKEEHISMYDAFVKRIREERGNGLLDKITRRGGPTPAGVTLNDEILERVRYYFIRDRIGLGILEPLIQDQYIEDISCSGLGSMFVEHKIFESIECVQGFTDNDALDKFAIYLSERCGRPVTHMNPIVDAALPDGSRINIVYGEDISKRGSNFTIRKFNETPISVTQLIAWKTYNSLLAAYMWMAMEGHCSLFVVGETASGKTTTLNAMLTFIPPNAKIVSIEDTPEVQVPHPNWTRELTRSSAAGAAVQIFDLVKAALRQRPNLIIVGEIRGEEGNVAFQAMQTGHPLVATFHAGTVRSLINRLTGTPINIPPAFIQLLDLVLIQNAIQDPNGKIIRRVLSVNELIEYVAKKDAFKYVELFAYDPATDSHIFRNSSYVLEKKIAKNRGLKRKEIKTLYDELFMRSYILDAMTEHKIFNYHEVYKILSEFKNRKKLPSVVVESIKKRMSKEE